MLNSKLIRRESGPQGWKMSNNQEPTFERARRAIDAIRTSIDALRQETNERWAKDSKNKWPRLSAQASIFVGLATLAFVAVNFYETIQNNGHFVQSQQAAVVSNKVQFMNFGSKEHTDWMVSAILENGGNTTTKNLRLHQMTAFAPRTAPDSIRAPDSTPVRPTG